MTPAKPAELSGNPVASKCGWMRRQIGEESAAWRLVCPEVEMELNRLACRGGQRFDAAQSSCRRVSQRQCNARRTAAGRATGKCDGLVSGQE